MKNKKTLLILLLTVIFTLTFCSAALALTWDDPGGIFAKSADKLKGFGIGMALLGFIGSWVLSAISFGDDNLINKGKKGATVAAFAGILIAASVQIFQWI